MRSGATLQYPPVKQETLQLTQRKAQEINKAQPTPFAGVDCALFCLFNK